MKLHLDNTAGFKRITGYGADFVLVNGERQALPLIVTAERLLPWPVAGFEQLGAADFQPLADLAAEVVLLGTGARLRFPAPALLAPLYAAGIGVEAMDLAAACRTYNILLAEGRRVVAALLH